MHDSYPWVRPDSEPVVVQGSFGAVAPRIEAQIRGLVHEVTDEHIERDKAGHRGLFLAEFHKILADCDRGDPDDPRWHELRLRTLREMAKLLRVYEADAPKDRHGGTNPADLAAAAARALAELETSLHQSR